MILLPSLLAAEAGGRGRFDTEASSLAAALEALPVRNLLFDEHRELRGLVNVYVDGVDMRELDGLATRLARTSTVRVVAAIAGGV